MPKEDYTVYPNPTSGPITVVSQSERFSKIQILNSIGDVQQEVIVTAPVQSVVLTGFPAGLNFLRISGVSEQKVEKVILQ
ncbi:MAG: T9SS type A sorting domain-containing protein [Bacteroidota bacterium]